MTDIAQSQPRTAFDLFALNRAMFAAILEMQRAALLRLQEIVGTGADALKASAKAAADLADDLARSDEAGWAERCRIWCLGQVETAAERWRSAAARLAEFLGALDGGDAGAAPARSQAAAVAVLSPPEPPRMAAVEQPKRRSPGVARHAPGSRRPVRKPARATPG